MVTISAVFIKKPSFEVGIYLYFTCNIKIGKNRGNNDFAMSWFHYGGKALSSTHLFIFFLSMFFFFSHKL